MRKQNVLNNLGYSHYRLGRLTGEVKLLQNALLHFEEALRIRNPETSPLGYSTILNNQGITYSALAELDDPKPTSSWQLRIWKKLLSIGIPKTGTGQLCDNSHKSCCDLYRTRANI